MKTSILLLLLLLETFYVLGQTTEDDFKYITENHIHGINSDNYNQNEIGIWGLSEGDIKRSITFIQIKTKTNNKKCGIIMNYKETKKNVLQKQIVFCLPEKSSKKEVMDSAFKLISDQSDEKLLETVVWGLMNYSN